MRQTLHTLALLALLALAACSTPATATFTIATVTPTPAAATNGDAGASASPAISQLSSGATPVTLTVTKEPTVTPTTRAAASPSPASRQCSYRMTGYMRNDDLTTRLQAALVAGGFPNATAQVDDAGENYACNDNTSGFGLMNRDLTMTLPVTDLADRQALGTQLAQILTLAAQYATTPSANRYLITFTAGGGQERVTATKAAWEQAQKQGLTGAALFDKFQSSSR